MQRFFVRGLLAGSVKDDPLMTDFPGQRRRWIAETVRGRGAVTSREVCVRFRVSISTAIRDLDAVALHLGHRVHGGLVRDALV
ncbi:DeoR family transcriptional regulator [Dactylosporangium sp. NPDC000244]|uniref:DeoR family transcriptional regulator n=1 Tax=Dactylosporangium sp. NPDC000244 TaxID=3154365 RepID=UPI0033284E2A